MEKGIEETTELGLNVLELRRFFAHAEVATFAVGEVLMTAGRAGGALYLVEEGELEVFGEEGNTEIVYAVVGPGDLIGEVGFLDGHPRTRSVRVQTACRVSKLERSAIEVLDFADRAAFYRLLALILARRFREVVAEVEKAHARGTESTSTLPVIRDGVVSSPDIAASVVAFQERFDEYYRSQQGAASSATLTAIAMAELMNELNAWLANVAAESQDMGPVGRHIARDLYPYLMRSKLLERLYVKPRAQACDYLALERMYGGVPAGADALGVEIDAWLMQTPLVRAYRSRRRWLAMALEREATRIFLTELHGYEAMEILALGSGPARALFDFIDRCQFSDQVNATCLDADIEALSYANTRVNVNPHQATVRFRRERMRVFAKRQDPAHHSQKDIVYAPLLCDHLGDDQLVAVVGRISEILKPGGVLLLVAHTDTAPQRVFARHVLDWPLRFRSPKALERLLVGAFDGVVDVRLTQGGNEVRITARSGRS